MTYSRVCSGIVAYYVGIVSRKLPECTASHPDSSHYRGAMNNVKQVLYSA